MEILILCEPINMVMLIFYGDIDEKFHQQIRPDTLFGLNEYQNVFQKLMMLYVELVNLLISWYKSSKLVCTLDMLQNVKTTLVR
jgi:hypothetical protein